MQNAAPLVGNTDREGADRWIRRGNAYGTISAIDAGGGDNVVVLDSLGWIGNVTRAGYAVQPFGAVTKNCSSVDFAADIRPPECFARSSDCFAYVEVGGDAYAQGDGEFRLPLVLAQASRIFHSSCEGKLRIALE